MTADEALALLDPLLQSHSLRDIQEQVFRHAWAGRTYPDMAERIGYDTGYIRDVGSELWRQLTQALGEPVTKNNLQAVLRRRRDRTTSALPNRSMPEVSQPSPSARDCYWGERIDVSGFKGREQELQRLERSLNANSEGDLPHSGCRLISIVGMGGIGKTSLAAKLTQKLAASTQAFERIIWQSLRNAPPLDKVLFQLIALLSAQQQTEPAATVDEQISRLMAYLGTCRCLLVFDNFESILAHHAASCTHGGYREGYAGYSELLRRIATEHHPSCAILTSREKPSTLIPLEGESTTVCTLDLHGLSAIEVQAIGSANGCHTSAPGDWEQLQQHYSGNPLAIKIAATTIRDLFDGSITAFLAQGVTLCEGIEALLSQQFDCLSELERQLLYWLAIDREPVSIAQLVADFIPSGFRGQLLVALQSLERRSLIEKSSGCFTLQPVVMEYVTARLIDRICAEITTLEVELFNTHALIQAQAKDYVRESQVRMILAPLAERLVGQWRSRPQTKERLDRLLAKLRSKFADTCGYAGGNLINLYLHLHIDLSGYDFSGLCIWQAYLLGMDLHDTNFANTDVAKSVFTETFASVHSLAFSPDGDCLASGDFNGDIRLWETRSHQLRATLKGHACWVQAVTYSPDRHLLASGSFDCTVKIWDLNTGRCLHTLTDHSQGVYAVAFSPVCGASSAEHGNLLASGSDDGTVKLWDVNSGVCLSSWQYPDATPDDVKCVAFSPDGRTIASSGSRGTIHLWQIQHGTHGCYWKTLAGHPGWVWSVAISPNGQLLASGSDDRTVKLWDVSTGECVRTLIGHNDELNSVAFARDGQMLISGSRDRTIRLWDVRTGACLKTLVGHQNWLWAMAVVSEAAQNAHPIHQLIASGGEDRTIRLWSLETGHCLKVLQGYANTLFSIAFVPQSGASQSSEPDLHPPVLLAGGYFDRSIRIWNMRNGTYSSLQGHTDAIRSVAVSPDGHILAGGGGSADSTLKLWSIRDGICLKNLSGHTNEIWSLAFSPEGQMLASASSDRTIRLWHVPTSECLHVLTGHMHWVMSVAYMSQSGSLASGSFDRTIKFWNVHTGECVRTWQVGQSICSIAVSPDGELLASGSVERAISLWDVATGECLQTLAGHSYFVWSVAFSPDGRLLASGSFDRTIRIWDLQTGACLKVLQGHESGVFTVAFVPQQDLDSPQLLASCGADATIRIWSIATGECQKVLRSPRPYEGMNIRGIQGLTAAQQEDLKALGATIGSPVVIVISK